MEVGEGETMGGRFKKERWHSRPFDLADFQTSARALVDSLSSALAVGVGRIDPDPDAIQHEQYRTITKDIDDLVGLLVPQTLNTVPPANDSARLSWVAQFMMQKYPFLCLMLVC